MQVAIHNTQNSPTYATEEFEAYPAEKEVRSVAFFTKTDDVGTFGDPNFQLGAFNKYFSTEALRSVNGLYEALTHTSAGYTASILVKSDGFGPRTQVYIFANYAENGLTDALKAIEKWEDLKHVKTLFSTTADNIRTPLLMIGYKGDIPLKSTQAEAATIRLSRIVSRIDIVNDAIDLVSGDPDKGFVLESAQVLRPREYSYLLPNNEFRSITPVLSSYPVVTAGNLPENDPKKVTALYMYETDNLGEELQKTVIRIKGTLLGAPYLRDIPLKKPDEKGKEGDPIALERNFRYQLTIKLVETSGEITWTIGIADWNDGTIIHIDPPLMTPVISAPDLTAATAANWDLATKTYLFEGGKNETVRFKATSLRTTVYTMAFEYENGASIGLDDPGSESYRKFLKIHDPVITYANVEQSFEVTTPQPLSEDYKVPVFIKLYIHDITDKFYKDSIKFMFLPKYLDTEYLPVKVGGVYWAPVNVGATKIIPNNITTSLEAYGYIYQWGRNLAFPPTPISSSLPGQVTYYNATEGTHKDVFITGVANWEWLLSSDTEGVKTRNSLWTKEVNQSPCPEGWRVPTAVDVNIFSSRSPRLENKYLVITGDNNGKNLYFPLSGYIHPGTASLDYPAARFYGWSVPASPLTHNSYYYSTSYGVTAHGVGHGFSLRCVQNVK